MPTKPEKKTIYVTNSNKPKINIFSALLNRLKYMSHLGQQYSGDRDLYEALGYKTTIRFADYLFNYKRLDIAKAIIDRPAKATWKGGIELKVPNKKDSELEKQWELLNKKHDLQNMFIRLDKLTCLGQYGVLFFGLNDVIKENQFKDKVGGTSSKLLYLKPLSQVHATIDQFETDTKSDRYGLPLLYKITTGDDKSEKTFDVHYSRVLHIVGETLESEYYGTPVLQSVFNRLYDLEKLVGGSAEMFWRNARPGYQGTVNDEYNLTPEVKEDLQDQLDEYEHNLRRMIVNEGIQFKPLSQEVHSPKEHVDVQISMISAVTGIPKRVLTGSERGELASTQDRQEWYNYVETRRENFCEPCIARPFINRCMEYNILPREEKYILKWSDLFSPSDKEKAEIGNTRAEAIKHYVSSPYALQVFPPESFYNHCLGLDEDEIDEIASSTIREIEAEVIESEQIEEVNE